MTRPLRALFVYAGLCAAASTAKAQGKTDCDFTSKGSAQVETVNGAEVTTAGGGITFICKARHIRVEADSGRRQGEDRADLYGHVHYVETDKIDLKSDFMTYIEPDERFTATGHVLVKMPTGSTLTGPEVIYLRIKPGRPFEEMTALRNPVAVIISKSDSTKPTTVHAVTLYMRGDSLVYASRSVVINRPDMIAHADSVFLDGRTGHETTRMMFNPIVEGVQGKKFKLLGEIIDAYAHDKKLDRVLARGKGHAVSQDLDILADTIDLHVTNDALEHAIAWSHPGQATATSPGQVITADSIDVEMPKGKVRIVHALRRAFAQADADSTHFRTPEKDWLRGDTVTAWFDTTATKDTSSTPPIKRILATNAKNLALAYYHLAATDTACHQPAVSYVRGREIQLDFDAKKIATVSVYDSVSGIYAEPCKDSTKVAGKTGTKTGLGKSAGTKTATKTTKPPTKTQPPPPAKPPATTTTVTKPPAIRREDQP